MNARFLGAALVALTLTAACGDQEAPPQTLPPVSAAPSPSPSAAPSVPPSAQAQTPQGAAEFARFFYAEIGKAFGERDPGRVERLSDPTCESCRLFIDSIAGLRDNDQTVTPVDFEIVLAEAPGFEGDQARVDVIYNLQAVQTTDASGKQIAEEPGVQGREIRLVLVRVGGSWLVKTAEAV